MGVMAVHTLASRSSAATCVASACALALASAASFLAATRSPSIAFCRLWWACSCLRVSSRWAQACFVLDSCSATSLASDAQSCMKVKEYGGTEGREGREQRGEGEGEGERILRVRREAKAREAQIQIKQSIDALIDEARSQIKNKISELIAAGHLNFSSEQMYLVITKIRDFQSSLERRISSLKTSTKNLLTFIFDTLRGAH